MTSQLSSTAADSVVPMDWEAAEWSDGELFLFLIDWDDTLMATTASSEVDAKQWASLELAVLAFLEQLLQLGWVVIVTNADRGWVEQSSTRYMPRVADYLQRNAIPIVSARSLFEVRRVASPSQAEQIRWKFLAMMTTLRDTVIRSRRRPTLVSIGDSKVERAAVFMVASHVSDLPPVKSIKLRRAPTIAQLETQLKQLTSALPSLTQHRGTLDVQIAQ